MQEWLWPFKTAEQRKLVAKYHKKQQRKKQLDDIELAPF
jgi:hypothetical protein